MIAQWKPVREKLTLNYANPTQNTRHHEYMEAPKNGERLLAELNPHRFGRRTCAADRVTLDGVILILLLLCCWEKKIKCL